jgi:hypothetical protein
MYLDANRTGRDTGVAIKLGEDVLLKLPIVFHGTMLS